MQSLQDLTDLHETESFPEVSLYDHASFPEGN